MALDWHTYACRPLAMGGAGEVLASVRADRVLVLVGSGAAVAWDAPGFLSVPLLERGGQWSATFFGAPRGRATLSFFAQVGGAWETGPVVPGVDLDWTASTYYPWVKGWFIERLQEIAAVMPPFGTDRPLPITGVFPRFEINMPSIVVQVNSQAQGNQLVGDAVGGRSRKTGDTLRRARQHNHTVQMEVWALTPEDRDEIAEWLGAALEVVIDACRAQGYEEPSSTISESEIPGGASTFDFPVFQATATVNLSAWSELVYPVKSFHGRLTVPN